MKRLEIIYLVLIFLIYRTVLVVTNFNLNTPSYGLFAVLTLLYFFTDNLNFSKKPRYKAIVINALIFVIFFLFYKRVYVFVAFLLFSIIQIPLQRLFVNLSKNYETKYNVKVANTRNLIKILLDTGSVIAALFLSFLLKYGLSHFLDEMNRQTQVIYVCIFLTIYIYMRVSEKSWRYTNVLDILYIIGINLATTAIFAAYLIFVKNIVGFPITALVTVPIFSISFQLFGRFLFRVKRYYINNNKSGNEKKKALIYGAGEAGVILAREGFTNPNFPYDIVGFIDDDPTKFETEIYKIKVVGTMKSLENVLERTKVDEILLALPSIKGKEIRKIIEKIKGVDDITIKTIPSIAEILDDRDLSTQLRNVQIEDLLGRDEIPINDTGIREYIEGNTIFVTGGAGSIGSELARQLAKYNPKRLVAIDINENDIYFLELELKRLYPNLDFITEICNIRELEKLEFLFEKYRPDIIFHAAAHKHVPLMEHNPEEAIKNNIFGTKNVAETALKYKVKRFVLISTDKAVNPTNLMGASKRACELVIEHMDRISDSTKFMAVRFGNVLGSHGSVIPIFKNLIEKGKNLTVTHRDITRYFMTIPEAAQLVIEAGSIGNGGEIFILDMGEPVKIYDLAKTMIKLSNADVGIDIVGLRPGEKLYEELLYDTKTAIKTDNQKIFITKVSGDRDITKFYQDLLEVTHNPDVPRIKEMMKKVVVSYKEPEYK